MRESMWNAFYRRTGVLTNGSPRCIVPAALCLLVVLILAACARPRPDGVAPATADEVMPTSAANEDSQDSASAVGAQPGAADEVVGQTDAPRTETAALNAPRFLLPEGRLQRLPPADAFIGDLVDSATAAQSDVYATARAFLRALNDADRAIALVVPEARSHLERVITDEGRALSDAPSIRIARARFVSAREAVVSVRLLVNDASTIGNLVVENRDNSWYIADMLLDLRELSRPDSRTSVERLEPWANRSPLVGP